MATFYLDHEGGNDANAGTSFALRWKTLKLGATAARIAPGDVIRVMKSADPTSLSVNGTFTKADYKNSEAFVVPIASFTNATPVVITTSISHLLTTGDYVQITGTAVNAVNGSWEITVLSATTFSLTGSVASGVGAAGGQALNRTSSSVKLSAALTATVACTANSRSAWTASANVTATVQTTSGFVKVSDTCDQIAIAAGFTTGLAAYKATGTLNLSGYQQLSFWICQTSGTIGAASSITLRLCSDAAGATPVDVFNIPALGALNTWHRFTVNKGSNLGAAIASIGFVVNTDNAAQTFRINNVIACKDATAANSLSLTSLIGKNDGNDTWYSILSIDDTRVALAIHGLGRDAKSQAGQYGLASGTVALYKRETIKLGPYAATSTATNMEVMDSGTSGNQIVFSGGWDQTAMTTQDGETWVDGVNGLGTGLTSASQTYYTIQKFGLVGFNNGFVPATSLDGIVIDACHFNACGNGIPLGTSVVGLLTIVNKLYACNNAGYGFSPYLYLLTADSIIVNGNNSSGLYNSSVFAASPREVNITSVVANGNRVGGVELSGQGCVVGYLECIGNSQAGVYLATLTDTVISEIVISENGSHGIVCNYGCDAYIASGTITTLAAAYGVYAFSTISLDNVVITGASVEFFASVTSGGLIHSTNHDGTSGNHITQTTVGKCQSNSTTRHTASGISWSLTPNTTSCSANFPLELRIATVLVSSGSAVTVTAWMQRSDAGLTSRLICKSPQLGGPASDTFDDVSVAINTWEQLTISWTPTEDGVVEIYAQTWGALSPTYVDDVEVTQ